MKPGTISRAFDLIEVEPSASFRDDLRAQFIDQMTAFDTSTTVVPVVTSRSAGNTNQTDEPLTKFGTAPSDHRRVRAIVGVAAALVLAVALSVLVVTRRPEHNAVSTVDDNVIAEEALLDADDLGQGWSPMASDGPTPGDMAAMAASIPACAAYLDYAFDSPHANAVVVERDFQGEPRLPLTNLAYIFASESEATAAMERMAEPAFQPCFNAFIDKLIAATGGFTPQTTTAVGTPSYAEHGDRQVIVPQRIEFAQDTFTVISFFVQVGRGIVYVDPMLMRADPLDSTGTLEATVAAATDALAAALRQPAD